MLPLWEIKTNHLKIPHLIRRTHRIRLALPILQGQKSLRSLRSRGKSANAK